jgi:hypothetical protein
MANTTGRRDFYKAGKVPKVVRVNAGRDEAAIYKNLGNAHRVKFLWAETTTLGKGGTSEVVASGTFGLPVRDAQGNLDSTYGRDSYFPGGLAGKTLADLHVFVTPLDEPAGWIWVDIDINDDTVIITSSAAGSDAGVDVDVLFFTT